MRTFPRRTLGPVEPTRLAMSDLLLSALDHIASRIARSILTAAGTLAAVAAFVTILGLTSTASGQISSDFTALTDTTVTVTDGAPTSASSAFPSGSDQRVDRLNGVVAAGTYWQLPGSGAEGVPVTALPPDPAGTAEGQSLPVLAATPGYLRADGIRLATGRLFDAFDEVGRQQVCVLGGAAANQLGITQLAAQPAIFINGVAFTVIGIISRVSRQPQDMLSILIPTMTAQQLWGLPGAGDSPAGMLIDTKVGAASLVGRQARFAILPTDPGRLQVAIPPDPQQLHNQVSGTLSSLFLALAAVCLAIGIFAIANTTLVAVVERTGEIGLRRALGARPRHIAAHILTESAVLGLTGGLVGAALGIVSVVVIAAAHRWTALLDPRAVLPTPAIGAAAGLIAGAYPAWRASRIQPDEALRR